MPVNATPRNRWSWLAAVEGQINVWGEQMKLSYLMFLQVSADSPDRLRKSDVDRVMGEAQQQGETEGFRKWLLANELRADTRREVEGWVAE